MSLGLESAASYPCAPRAWPHPGALTQVSYILSGFSFLRVDLEQRQSHFSVGEKDTFPQRSP